MTHSELDRALELNKIANYVLDAQSWMKYCTEVHGVGEYPEHCKWECRMARALLYLAAENEKHKGLVTTYINLAAEHSRECSLVEADNTALKSAKALNESDLQSMITLENVIRKLRLELEAYKKAKAENDERFQLEIGRNKERLALLEDVATAVRNVAGDKDSSHTETFYRAKLRDALKALDAMGVKL